MKSNANRHQCALCQGTPRQHNVRDATIYVDSTDKQYPQHGFIFKGNN